MSKTKRVLFIFSLLDYKAMEEYFEKMAAQGWILEKINIITAKFRKAEPQNLKFSVDIFPYISAFDSHDSENAMDYRKLCEESGWHFVTSSNKLQVFCAKVHENPIPIQTDSVVEEKILRKSIFSTEFLIFLICLPILLLSLGSLFPFDYSKLFTNGQIVSTVATPILIIPVALYTGYYGIWFWKAKRNIKRGVSLPRTSLKVARLRGLFLVFIAVFIILAYIIALIIDAIGGHTFPLYFLVVPISGVLIGIWFKKIVLAKVRSRWKNIIIFTGAILVVTLVFSMFTIGNIASQEGMFKSLMGMKGELPEEYEALKLEHFGLNEKPNTIVFSKKSSFVVPESYEYHEISEEGVVRTMYYKAINPSMASYIHEGMLDREGSLLYRSINIAPAKEWNVDKAYYLKDDKTMLLLLKDEIVILLDGSFDLSLPDIRNISKNKLNLIGN